jgi:hypothetical protein
MVPFGAVIYRARQSPIRAFLAPCIFKLQKGNVKLERAGCEVKFGGKHTDVKIPAGKKNILFSSLAGYTKAERG